MYDPALRRFTTVDPMAESFSFQSPYLYAKNNPIKFIDVMGLFAGNYVTEKGKTIGRDENTDDKIFIVKDKTSIGKIKDNKKAGKTTPTKSVSIAVETTKTELREAIDVLGRTEGTSEESSVISNTGVVSRGVSGSGKAQTRSDGTVVYTAELPAVAGNDNTSIHSHILKIKWNEDGSTGSSSASKPGPDDPKTFKGYKSNIIVGNLKHAYQTRSKTALSRNYRLTLQ